MPTQLQSYINSLDTSWDYVHTAFYGLRLGFNWLGSRIAAQDWAQAAQACYDMRDYIIDIRDYMTDDYLTTRYYVAMSLQYINDDALWTAPPITMTSILDAMWEATAIEYHHFIGYIDAYRANMWNLPFYTEWHSLLTRHFG